MLAVQVQYWSLKENERHNKVTEAETTRHNKETESLGWASLDEQIRHNTATESIMQGQLAETTRHNIVTEDLGYINAKINQQNADSNRISAQAAMSQAGAAWANAETNRQRVEYDYSLGLMAQQTAADNAETNARRATNDWQLGWSNLEVAKERNKLEESGQQIRLLELDETKRNDTWRNINGSIDSAVNAAAKAAPYVSTGRNPGLQGLESYMPGNSAEASVQYFQNNLLRMNGQ